MCNADIVSVQCLPNLFADKQTVKGLSKSWDTEGRLLTLLVLAGNMAEVGAAQK